MHTVISCVCERERRSGRCGKNLSRCEETHLRSALVSEGGVEARPWIHLPEFLWFSIPTILRYRFWKQNHDWQSDQSVVYLIQSPPLLLLIALICWEFLSERLFSVLRASHYGGKFGGLPSLLTDLPCPATRLTIEIDKPELRFIILYIWVCPGTAIPIELARVCSAISIIAVEHLVNINCQLNTYTSALCRPSSWSPLMRRQPDTGLRAVSFPTRCPNNHTLLHVNHSACILLSARVLTTSG